MPLTEANDLVAILNQVLDCYRVSVTVIDEALVIGVYRTDTAGIEATGVGKANLLGQRGQLGREHGNWRCGKWDG
jgi:translation initiation factor 6 (eIF-6)